MVPSNEQQDTITQTQHSCWHVQSGHVLINKENPKNRKQQDFFWSSMEIITLSLSLFYPGKKRNSLISLGKKQSVKLGLFFPRDKRDSYSKKKNLSNNWPSTENGNEIIEIS